jgi:hypothetical protein
VAAGAGGGSAAMAAEVIPPSPNSTLVENNCALRIDTAILLPLKKTFF